MAHQSVHAARVAVIFNAASPLSRALAMDFALQGFSLALCDEDATCLENTVDECFNAVKISPFKVSTFEIDLFSEESVKNVAEEIFTEFGRIDVLCFVEHRHESEDYHGYRTVFSPQKTLNPSPDLRDFQLVLNFFFSKLKREKPVAPPIAFLDGLEPDEPRRRRRPNLPEEEEEEEDDDDSDDEDSLAATSLLLLVTTPDYVACRAGRYRFCARTRSLEALVEGINAEAIIGGDRVRCSTAVVGTLDGELPFWRTKQREELVKKLLVTQEEEEEMVAKSSQSLSSHVAITPPFHSRSTPAASTSSIREQMQSLMRLKRRPSRARGLISSPLVTNQLNNDEEEEEDTTNNNNKQVVPLEKLTSECLSHEEASGWIIWGLARGRFRILVGYDLLLLESAWLPNEFLNRLFAFSGGGPRRNLIPLRTRQAELQEVKENRQYNADRLRRHRTRQGILFVLCLFAVFTPMVAVGWVLFASLWSYAVISKEGHTVTERAVSSLLYAVSLRRRIWVKKTWTYFRHTERFVFGSLAKFHRNLESFLGSLRNGRWRGGGRKRRL